MKLSEASATRGNWYQRLLNRMLDALNDALGAVLRWMSR